MVIVRLKGGMGNQMFQYAFGLALAKKLNTRLKIDLTMLLDRNKGDDFVYRDYDLEIFNVQPKFLLSPGSLRFMFSMKSGRLGWLLHKWTKRGKNYFREPHFQVVEELLDNPKDHTIYEGWWQSERYFETVANEVRKQFRFKDPILNHSTPLYEQIKSTNVVKVN